jgi:DNA-directed RNA polymerase specialized sigma24 family protein
MHSLHYRFIAAYDAFVHDIFNYFLSKTMHRETAKDLTEETFAKTWQEISSRSDHEHSALELRAIYKVLRKNAESISVMRDLTFAL